MVPMVIFYKPLPTQIKFILIQEMIQRIMKNFSIICISFSFLICSNEGSNIPYCSNNQSEHIQICKKDNNHTINRPPKPHPIKVIPILDLKDVHDVDVERETLTVYVKIVLWWEDFSISVITPNDTV